MNVNPKAELDQIARFQQMKINARLTALQSAQALMATPGYSGIAGETRNEKGELVMTWEKPPGAVDMITLIATAQEIENYILGQIEEESLKALENAAAKLNGPKIVRP